MTRVRFTIVVRASLAVGVWLMWPAVSTAHRLDEYLQATRIAVEDDRVDVDIDLTNCVTSAATLTISCGATSALHLIAHREVVVQRHVEHVVAA